MSKPHPPQEALAAILAAILDSHAGHEGALLPILHAVQAAFGCVSPAAEAAIAEALNLSRAEVHGVASFYPDFNGKADPRPCVKLCRAEACQARGAEALVAGAQAAAGDAGLQGAVRLEAVYCLGLCSVGPAALVGDTPHARLDADRLAALIRAQSGAQSGAAR